MGKIHNTNPFRTYEFGLRDLVEGKDVVKGIDVRLGSCVKGIRIINKGDEGYATALMRYGNYIRGVHLEDKTIKKLLAQKDEEGFLIEENGFVAARFPDSSCIIDKCFISNGKSVGMINLDKREVILVRSFNPRDYETLREAASMQASPNGFLRYSGSMIDAIREFGEFRDLGAYTFHRADAVEGDKGYKTAKLDIGIEAALLMIDNGPMMAD
ncbi:MAG: hypothetical protein ABIH72_01805 [archaeon]